MTAVPYERAGVHVMDRVDAQRQIRALERSAGMNTASLRHQGNQFRLDARARSILDKIEGLEWLVRASDTTAR